MSRTMSGPMRGDSGHGARAGPRGKASVRGIRSPEITSHTHTHLKQHPFTAQCSFTQEDVGP